MTTLTSSVDRITCIAKILLDERVFELRRENEELKRQAEWAKYCPDALERLLCMANTYDERGGVVPGCCTCYACFRGLRFDPRDVWSWDHQELDVFELIPMQRPCLVKRRLQEQARLQGLSMVVIDRVDGASDPRIPEMGGGCRTDVHLEIHEFLHGDWRILYGTRLHAQCPDLCLLKNLFQALLASGISEWG
jgi:hypothetical protein